MADFRKLLLVLIAGAFLFAAVASAERRKPVVPGTVRKMPE